MTSPVPPGNSQTPAADPFAGLKNFYRDHGTFMNQLTMSVMTLCGVFDFLVPSKPQFAFVARIVLATVILLMLVSVKNPRLAQAVLSLLGATAAKGVSVWRNRRWQLTVVALVGAVVFLGESHALAAKGGVIGSQVASVHDLQQKLLTEQLAEMADPRVSLQKRGISYDYGGLNSAIEQRDLKAIEWFAQAGYRADNPQPLVNLFNFFWDPEVAKRLPEEMFARPDACIPSSASDYRWAIGAYLKILKPATEEKAATLRRLCKSDELRKHLEGMLTNAAPKTDEEVANLRWALDFLAKK